jgi:IMP dehydrogenase
MGENKKMINEACQEPLDYQDILLLPRPSTVISRDDVVLANSSGINPFFSAPMKNISEPDLIIELAKFGAVGLLHRFMDMNERRTAIDKISFSVNQFRKWGVAIGINDFEIELRLMDYAISMGANYICLDVANGYLKNVVEGVRTIAEILKGQDVFLICGNVVTFEGAANLAEAGANYIRVGIGNGSLCSTSNATGIGCPSLTAIQDCSRIKSNYQVNIIADGGIRFGGDAIKAIAFGADAVMIGSLFGEAKEANNGGTIYGMSSYTLQEKMGKRKKSNEGLVKQIQPNNIQSLEAIYNSFTYEMKSSLSYLGCSRLDDLHDTWISYIRTGKGTLKNL